MRVVRRSSGVQPSGMTPSRSAPLMSARGAWAAPSVRIEDCGDGFIGTEGKVAGVAAPALTTGPLAGARTQRLARRWGQPTLLGLSAVGLAGTISIFLAGGGPGFDTYAYWLTGHGPLYAVRDSLGSFQYTPAALFFLWPVSILPWPLAYAAWLAISAGALVALGRRWALALLLFVPVPMELYEGNVHLLLALAIVVGFRYPAAWAFVLVTKVTPGIGLLWFAVRREWRSLGIALGTTGLLIAASLVIPGAWAAWWAHTTDNPQGMTPNQIGVPLWLRLPLAVVVVIWGARTDRRWTVVMAATLALPSLWFYGLSMLVGMLPLRHRPATAPPPELHARGAMPFREPGSPRGAPSSSSTRSPRSGSTRCCGS